MPHARLRRYLRHGMLPQLMVFEAVARLGSFTRAAEELFMAQPTVSIHVRKLTETLGAPLLEQIGKRIYLTDAGRELQRICHDIFGKLLEIDERLAEMREPGKGRLRLAVTTTAKYFAPRLLGDFCRRYPELEVSLQVFNRQRLLERMAENLDDLCVLGNPPETEDVIVHPLRENPMVVLAPADHPLAGKKSIPLGRIAAEPMLMREAGSGTRMVVEQTFAEAGLKPRIRMEVGSNEAIKQAVLGGLGIAVLSRETVNHGGREGLCVLDVQGFPLKRYWYLVHPAGKQLSPVAQEFVQFAVEAGRRAPVPGKGKADSAGRERRRRALSPDQNI